MAEKTNEMSEPDVLIKNELREPEKYKIVLYNDDYTTKDFVVFVLKTIFKKNEAQAVILMETVHREGSAVAGVFIRDIAASMVFRVTQLARNNGFPLLCVMEKE